MRFLLDTCVLMWSLTGDKRVTTLAKTLTDPSNDVFFSPMSIWEIAIKNEKGKTNITPEVAAGYALKQGFEELPISLRHIWEIKTINYPEGMNHRDPFDNILVAQAKNEGLTLLTGDEVLAKYRESCIRKV